MSQTSKENIVNVNARCEGNQWPRKMDFGPTKTLRKKCDRILLNDEMVVCMLPTVDLGGDTAVKQKWSETVR